MAAERCVHGWWVLLAEVARVPVVAVNRYGSSVALQAAQPRLRVHCCAAAAAPPLSIGLPPSAIALQYRWHVFKSIRAAIDANEGGLDKFTQGVWRISRLWLCCCKAALLLSPAVVCSQCGMLKCATASHAPL